MKKFIVAAFLSIGMVPYASADVTTKGAIVKIVTWPHTEHVVIEVSPTHEACPGGFWFSTGVDKPASANVVSTTLAAKFAKTQVRVHADENSDWSGTSTKKCELEALVAY